MRSYEEMLALHKVDRPDKAQDKIMSEVNLFPLNAKIGLIFTCHMGHMPYMKYALQQYRKIEDMFIVGAYDSRIVTPDTDKRRGFPFPDIWYLAHMWFTKHYTWGGHHKRHGWIWLQIYASSILRQYKNIKYIFTANGDCVWDRPEGVNEIIEMLGDNDFMSGQSQTRETDGWEFIHTCSMVFKRDAYFDFIDFILDMMPDSSTVSFSPEYLIQLWTKEHNIKWDHAPVQPYYTTGEFKGRHDTYCEEGGPSTWRDVLGFRNLESEKNWLCSKHKEPLDVKYFDLRDIKLYYRDHDKNTLVNYYLTGDERYIRMWWDQDPYEVPREIRIERMKKNLEDY
jgi:hypothetical protein